MKLNGFVALLGIVFVGMNSISRAETAIDMKYCKPYLTDFESNVDLPLYTKVKANFHFSDDGVLKVESSAVKRFSGPLHTDYKVTEDSFSAHQVTKEIDQLFSVKKVSNDPLTYLFSAKSEKYRIAFHHFQFTYHNGVCVPVMESQGLDSYGYSCSIDKEVANDFDSRRARHECIIASEEEKADPRLKDFFQVHGKAAAGGESGSTTKQPTSAR